MYVGVMFVQKLIESLFKSSRFVEPSKFSGSRVQKLLNAQAQYVRILQIVVNFTTAFDPPFARSLNEEDCIPPIKKPSTRASSMLVARRNGWSPDAAETICNPSAKTSQQF